jgi:hypothetical protein
MHIKLTMMAIGLIIVSAILVIGLQLNCIKNPVTTTTSISSTTTAQGETATVKTTQNNQPPANIRVNVLIGDKTYTVNMFDNPTSNDLLSLLPLTLTFSDYGRQEKLATAPRALTMKGVPNGSDPEINEFGYYAPSNVLVFYYSDVGYFNGIVRLGIFESSIAEIRSLPDGITVTIERAD